MTTNQSTRIKEMESLQLIHNLKIEKLHEINQLSLNAWISLSKELNVPMNDRDWASKKLAIRQLKAEGAL